MRAGRLREEAIGLVVLLLLLLVGIATVPLAGGELRGLARLRFRHAWLLVAILGTQVWLIARPGPQTTLLTIVQLSAFPLGLVFLAANRHVAGLGIVALGAAMNFAAIAANGGVMPALPDAVAFAGLPLDGGGLYANSAALSHPRLLLLGDVFAVPAALPLANAFSIGDLVVVIGATVVAHRAGRSRLFATVGGAPIGGFPLGRLWTPWSVALMGNLGAWVYSALVGAVLFQRLGADGAARAIVTLLVGQLASAVLVGLTLAGSALGCAHPATVTALTHLGRAVAVISLAIPESPSEVQLLVVAVALGALGAMDRPILWGAMMDRVPDEHLVTASASMNAGSQLAIVVGPYLGAGMVGLESPRLLLIALGAALAAMAWIAQRSASISYAGSGSVSAGRALRGPWSEAASNPVMRTTLLVCSLGLVGLAWSGPIAPLFVRAGLLEGAGSRDLVQLELLVGCLGVGMLLGSWAGPAVARTRELERTLLALLIAAGLIALSSAGGPHVTVLLLAALGGGFVVSLVALSVQIALLRPATGPSSAATLALAGAACDLPVLLGAAILAVTGTRLSSSAWLAAMGACLLLAAMAVVSSFRRRPEAFSRKETPRPLGPSRGIPRRAPCRRD